MLLTTFRKTRTQTAILTLLATSVATAPAVFADNRPSTAPAIEELDKAYLFNASQLNRAGQEATTHVDRELNQLDSQGIEDLARTVLGETALSDQELDWHASSARQDNTFGVKEVLRTEQILSETEGNIRALTTRLDKSPMVENPQWVWNSVGGVKARIKILYCSPREYIALFGTQLPQEGFSGLYSGMDVWDIILTGAMYSNGSSSKQAFPLLYKPGNISLLKRGQSRYYNMDRLTYMIDYGRGSISKAFWQGVVAPYLVNQDTQSLMEQLKKCGASYIKNFFE